MKEIMATPYIIQETKGKLADWFMAAINNVTEFIIIRSRQAYVYCC